MLAGDASDLLDCCVRRDRADPVAGCVEAESSCFGITHIAAAAGPESGCLRPIDA